MTRRQAVGALLLVCLIWGVSFTVLKETLVLVSPLMLMGLKFGLAARALIFLTLTGLWAFYMQLRAQQVLSPSHMALIFTLEPVFAALTSFVALGERLETLQWAGAALILAAMALPALERPT